MARRKNLKKQGRYRHKEARDQAVPVADERVESRMRRPLTLLVTGVTAAAAMIILVYLVVSSGKQKPDPSVLATHPHHAPPTAAAQHVGGAVCKECHARQFDSWKSSHHARAMQEATAETVLGNFDNAVFTHNGVESRFYKRDDRFIVRTDGPDGQLTDYAVKYTFGVFPLQQYLIAFPGGRYQALSIAWDSRTRELGGQKWFHLYPNDKIDHTDALHWTGRYQNWNLQCAACHSTDLRKNYDAASDAYATTWKEISVSCEACHGPGSNHVSWAKTTKPPYKSDDVKALEGYLKSRWDEAWRFPSGDAKYAVRDASPPSEVINACAACHARRSTLKEGASVTAPLYDAYRPALLTPPLYHVDGQQHDEVYVWGSFTQSKMFQRGVTCMDCHEPHALKLRADGNALCGRCHNPTVFDTKQHHRHELGTKGASCASCHMPSTTYMVVHARPDHSFRVPRPDLSTAIGTPNACTTCHTDRNPEWAAAALDGWYGTKWRGRPHFGSTLHAGMTQGLRGLPDLLALAQDIGQPAIVRATAMTLAQRNPPAHAARDVGRFLVDGDAAVRIAAIGLAEGLDQAARARLISPLLSDPILGVRIEAARVLIDIPAISLRPEHVAARV